MANFLKLPYELRERVIEQLRVGDDELLLSRNPSYPKHVRDRRAALVQLCTVNKELGAIATRLLYDVVFPLSDPDAFNQQVRAASLLHQLFQRTRVVVFVCPSPTQSSLKYILRNHGFGTNLRAIFLLGTHMPLSRVVREAGQAVPDLLELHVVPSFLQQMHFAGEAPPPATHKTPLPLNLQYLSAGTDQLKDISDQHHIAIPRLRICHDALARDTADQGVPRHLDLVFLHSWTGLKDLELSSDLEAYIPSFLDLPSSITTLRISCAHALPENSVQAINRLPALEILELSKRPCMEVLQNISTTVTTLRLEPRSVNDLGAVLSLLVQIAKDPERRQNIRWRTLSVRFEPYLPYRHDKPIQDIMNEEPHRLEPDQIEKDWRLMRSCVGWLISLLPGMRCDMGHVLTYLTHWRHCWPYSPHTRSIRGPIVYMHPKHRDEGMVILYRFLEGINSHAKLERVFAPRQLSEATEANPESHAIGRDQSIYRLAKALDLIVPESFRYLQVLDKHGFVEYIAPATPDDQTSVTPSLHKRRWLSSLSCRGTVLPTDKLKNVIGKWQEN